MLFKVFISSIIIGVFLAVLSLAIPKKWIRYAAMVVLAVAGIDLLILLFLAIYIFGFDGTIPELIDYLKSLY